MRIPAARVLGAACAGSDNPKARVGKLVTVPITKIGTKFLIETSAERRRIEPTLNFTGILVRVSYGGLEIKSEPPGLRRRTRGMRTALFGAAGRGATSAAAPNRAVLILPLRRRRPGGSDLISRPPYDTLTRMPVKFSVGSILRRSADVSIKNFVPIFVIGTVTSFPTLAFGLSDPAHAAPSTLAAGILISSLLTALCQAAVVYGTIQALNGETARFGESALLALKRLLPVCVAWLLISLIAALGFLLLIVPGLSAELTTGYRWPIFWALILIILAAATVEGVIGAALHRPPFLPLFATLDFMWSALVASFSGVVAAVVYHDLRALKEPAN